MKRATLVLLGILGCTAASATDCTRPTPPKLPDGATSSMEEMLAGQNAVKNYQAANLEYMNCLEPKLSAAHAEAEGGGEAARASHRKLEDAYNAAVSEEQGVADQFDSEVREYHAVHTE